MPVGLAGLAKGFSVDADMDDMQPVAGPLADRLDREAQFHDDRMAALAAGHRGSREPQTKYYWSTQKYADRAWGRTLELAHDSDVLELGCFHGSRTLRAAAVANEVIGVDISPASVQWANETLKTNDAANASAYVADVEDLPFEDDRFDLVFGTGIIHHVDVEKVCQETRRVLKPGGYAVFVEPLAHNPLLRLYRKLTPSARTVDEHPLGREDLARIYRILTPEEANYFGLFSVLAAPARRFPLGEWIRVAVNTADDLLLKLDLLKPYAWQVHLTLRKPARALGADHSDRHA